MQAMTSMPAHIANQNDDRQFYTVPEAARLLQVSQSTLWRWIDAGKLSAYRVGPRRIIIRKQDLEAVVQPVKPGKREVMTAARKAEEGQPEHIWAGYDPEKVKEAIARMAGSWADLDTEGLIAELYRAREQGSRPASRP